MKPVIALSCAYNQDAEAYSLKKNYCEIIEKCGGIPFIMPYLSEVNSDEFLNTVSGVLFTGGGDIAPNIAGFEHAVYSQNCNEERDLFELNLCKKCYEKNVPVLGICRGMQLMSVAAGGQIAEDISLISAHAKSHRQTVTGNIPTHKIHIQKDSLLYKILEKDTVYVNSFHHQCVTDGGFLRLSAFAKDGVAEAAEFEKDNSFALGVQWHPERCLSDGVSEKIIKYFIEKCKK